MNPIWVLPAVGEVPGKWAIAGGIIVIAGISVRNVAYAMKAPKLEGLKQKVTGNMR